jgi:hypothetical protein
MAVLVEGISVVIRADALLRAFADDWEAFKQVVPNATLCADGELARVGFMCPEDVEHFVSTLSQNGLAYLVNGEAKDLIVVDQMRGPLVRCDWIEFGHIDLDGDTRRRIAACRLCGSTLKALMKPDGWEFEGSLSQSFGFVPSQHRDRSLRFLRHEGGMDVYLNEATGEEVFVGRGQGKAEL